jgi:hypothetical protein
MTWLARHTRRARLPTARCGLHLSGGTWSAGTPLAYLGFKLVDALLLAVRLASALVTAPFAYLLDRGSASSRRRRRRPSRIGQW